VIERFLARPCRFDEYREIGPRLFLPDEFRQPLRAQRSIRIIIALVGSHKTARTIHEHDLVSRMPRSASGTKLCTADPGPFQIFAIPGLQRTAIARRRRA
jgi:hypothetical protein